MYASCSLLAASLKCNLKKGLDEETNKGAIEACVEWLMDNEFISIQKEGEGSTFYAIFLCLVFLKQIYIYLLCFVIVHLYHVR